MEPIKGSRKHLVTNGKLNPEIIKRYENGLYRIIDILSVAVPKENAIRWGIILAGDKGFSNEVFQLPHNRGFLVLDDEGDGVVYNKKAA